MRPAIFVRNYVPASAKYDLDQAINTEKNKLEKSRRQILVEAAIELENEGKIPIYSICSFLVTQLSELLKARTIRQYLPDK